MLRKTVIIACAAALYGLITPRAASAADQHAFEYGPGWGDGVVYGPVTPHYYPHDYPYEGYPLIGYDGPPFYLVWDYGDCYVLHRPGHRHLPPRTLQLCE